MRGKNLWNGASNIDQESKSKPDNLRIEYRNFILNNCGVAAYSKRESQTEPACGLFS